MRLPITNTIERKKPCKIFEDAWVNPYTSDNINKLNQLSGGNSTVILPSATSTNVNKNDTLFQIAVQQQADEFKRRADAYERAGLSDQVALNANGVRPVTKGKSTVIYTDPYKAGIYDPSDLKHYTRTVADNGEIIIHETTGPINQRTIVPNSDIHTGQYVSGYLPNTNQLNENGVRTITKGKSTVIYTDPYKAGIYDPKDSKHYIRTSDGQIKEFHLTNDLNMNATKNPSNGAGFDNLLKSNTQGSNINDLSSKVGKSTFDSVIASPSEEEFMSHINKDVPIENVSNIQVSKNNEMYSITAKTGEKSMASYNFKLNSDYNKKVADWIDHLPTDEEKFLAIKKYNETNMVDMPSDYKIGDSVVQPIAPMPSSTSTTVNQTFSLNNDNIRDLINQINVGILEAEANVQNLETNLLSKINSSWVANEASVYTAKVEDSIVKIKNVIEAMKLLKDTYAKTLNDTTSTQQSVSSSVNNI